MAINVKAQLKNFDKLKEKIEDIEKSGKQAITDTVNDLKRRAPGWVADAVTERYAIKKAEITPATSEKPKKTAGGVRATGETLETFAIVYSGRLLTATHFKMKPAARPLPGKRYNVSAEILKGKRKVLASKAFLGTTGTREESGVQHIPFQRKGDGRLPIESIKSISLPQMVDNAEVQAKIETSLGEGMQKRLDQNVERRLGL
jgi:hypothetical protein